MSPRASASGFGRMFAPPLSESFTPSVIGSTLIERRERLDSVELCLYGELTRESASVLGAQVSVAAGDGSAPVLLDLCGLADLETGALDELAAVQRASDRTVLIRVTASQAAVLAGSAG